MTVKNVEVVMNIEKIHFLSSKMHLICPRSFSLEVIENYNKLPDRLVKFRDNKYISSLCITYDIESNKIFLIANKFDNEEEVIDSWFREVIFHQGLWALFDYDKEQNFLNDIKEKLSKIKNFNLKKFKRDEFCDEAEMVREVIATYAYKSSSYLIDGIDAEIWNIIKDSIDKLYIDIYRYISGEDPIDVSYRVDIIISGLRRYIFYGIDYDDEEDIFYEELNPCF